MQKEVMKGVCQEQGRAGSTWQAHRLELKILMAGHLWVVP
jgi:hypothetical protein